MLDVALVALQMALGILVPAAIVRFDERRLAPQALERAWPPASFWMAVVVFGPLCLPVHFWRTRRSVLGVLMGVAAFALALAAQVLVASGVAALFGE